MIARAKKDSLDFYLGKTNSWLLLPSIFLSISLGFLGLLVAKHAYFEIKAVEYEDISFLSLKIVLGIGGFLGFFFRRYIHGQIANIADLTLILLTILEIFFIQQFSSGILQVDYIFHTGIFHFLTFLTVFTSGYYLGSLKKLRLWAFLIGGISVFAYSYLYKQPEINTEYFIIPILCFLVLEICLQGFLQIFNKIILPKKNNNNNHHTTDVFFYSTLSLLIAQLLIFYYRSSGGPDAFITGGGIGFLIFNIIYHFNIMDKKVRYLFLGGRIAVLVNLALTVQQAYLDVIYFWLFFLDMSLIAIFRPSRYNSKFFLASIISGTIIAFVSYKLHLLYTKTEYLYAFLLVIVVLVWLPLVLKNEFGILQKIILLSLSYLIVIRFFSPLPYIYSIQKSDRIEVPPIPFLMSSIELNQNDFIFYNTNLPFKNSSMLPKRVNFKNKISVIGINENPELVLTYVKYLDKNSYPYLIFQNKNLPRLSREEIFFSFEEFPLFRVYFPEKGIPGLDIKKKFSNSWEVELVENRVKELTTNEEIIDVILNLIRYNPPEVIRIAKGYQEKIFKSYKRYAEFYFEDKNYRQAIKLASLAMNYEIEDDSLFETTFESLIRISPEEDHIPIMKKLINKEKYKIETLIRLYPLLLTINEEKEALYYMDILIEFFKKNKDNERLSLLFVEKFKISIKNSKYSEAEDMINREKSKFPELLIWTKLISELKYYKETTYRPYYYYYGARQSQDSQKGTGD
jgi:hypothetical protein